MANLTEQEFSKHIGTQFKTSFADREVSLILVEVKAYMPQANEESGMERFSVFFDGPPDVRLPQQTHLLRHARMGELDIFLGPITGGEKALRYEAVFNYYK